MKEKIKLTILFFFFVVFLFLSGCFLFNRAPLPPVVGEEWLNGGVAPSLTPLLSWKCIDPDGDPMYYDVYFSSSYDKVKNMDKDALIAEGITETSLRLNMLSNYTTYYWRVVVRDEKGNITIGDIWWFKTGEAPPPTPTPTVTPEIFVYITQDIFPITPEGGEKDVEYLNPLKLLWTKIGVGGRNVVYYLYFSEDGNKVNREDKSVRIATLEDNYYIVSALERGTTYYWKVVGVIEVEKGKGKSEKEEVVVGKSKLLSFTTILNHPPTKPEKISPGNRSLHRDDEFSVTEGKYVMKDVTLKWEKSTDPDGDPLTYEIYIKSVDNDGNGVVIKNYEDIGDVTSYTFSVDYCHKYVWDVRAKDSYGGESKKRGDNGWEFYTPGYVKWRFRTGDRIDSSPAIGDDGTIYVGSEDNNLYAINPDGSLKWKFETGSDIYSSPAIGDDGTIYVGSMDINLYAINPEGGKKWTYSTGGWIIS